MKLAPTSSALNVVGMSYSNVINYSSSKNAKPHELASLAETGKLIHVMSLVKPYVEQAYQSSDQAAEQMGHCLAWFEKTVAEISGDAVQEFLESCDSDTASTMNDLDPDLVRFWAGLVCQLDSLSGKDLESLVYFGGCYLGFIQQLAEMQRQQGAEDVAIIMEKAFEKLSAFIEFADQTAADQGIIRLVLA